MPQLKNRMRKLESQCGLRSQRAETQADAIRLSAIIELSKTVRRL
jgi:hypothetical protein